MEWTFNIIRSPNTWLITNIALILLLLIMLVVYLCGRSFYSYLDRAMQYLISVRTTTTRVSDQPTIDWVDIESVVSFLFEYEWLPTDDAKHWLGLSNKWVSKLGDNLDRVGITAKDPKNNNRRTLVCQDPDYIMTLLLSHTDSDKIWSYTATSVDFMVKPLAYAG